MQIQIAISLIVVLAAVACTDATPDGQQQQQPINISTTITKRLFTYAGPLLPSDWNLVSIWNDRALIGFNNMSSRYSLLDELEPKDKVFLQRLQNGTVSATPLATAKEKLSQWSSTVTSTVSKFGRTFKDSLDKFIENNYKGNTTISATPNITLVN